MVVSSVPERLRWVVGLLAVRPTDRVLEIGCGRGAAVSLVGDRLGPGGRVVGIDRSAKMIALARERNAAHLAAGRAELRTEALAEWADLPDPPDPPDPAVPRAPADPEPHVSPRNGFDKIFAVNVNLFWVRSPARELACVKRALAPGGQLFLGFEPPGPARLRELADTLPAILADHGFEPELRTAPGMLCAIGQPRGG